MYIGHRADGACPHKEEYNLKKMKDREMALEKDKGTRHTSCGDLNDNIGVSNDVKQVATRHNSDIAVTKQDLVNAKSESSESEDSIDELIAATKCESDIAVTKQELNDEKDESDIAVTKQDLVDAMSESSGESEDSIDELIAATTCELDIAVTKQEMNDDQNQLVNGADVESH